MPFSFAYASAQESRETVRVSLGHSAKASLPMEVMPSGRVRSVRELQRVNAASPMEVMPSGRAMEVRELQPLNAA